jgi:hypothetical protein
LQAVPCLHRCVLYLRTRGAGWHEPWQCAGPRVWQVCRRL